MLERTPMEAEGLNWTKAPSSALQRCHVGLFGAHACYRIVVSHAQTIPRHHQGGAETVHDSDFGAPLLPPSDLTSMLAGQWLPHAIDSFLVLVFSLWTFSGNDWPVCSSGLFVTGPTISASCLYFEASRGSGQKRPWHRQRKNGVSSAIYV